MGQRLIMLVLYHMTRRRTWFYGPVLRSTGVAWDIRRLEPYDIYLY